MQKGYNSASTQWNVNLLLVSIDTVVPKVSDIPSCEITLEALSFTMISLFNLIKLYLTLITTPLALSDGKYCLHSGCYLVIVATQNETF